MVFEKRTKEDKWLLSQLNKVTEKVTEGFEKYDYAMGRETMEKFFWMTFCDNYLEIVKDRFWHPERYSDEERKSAQSTLWEALRVILGLMAPYIPFVTEELWQKIYKPYEDAISLHVTSFPKANKEWDIDVKEMQTLLSILRTVRQLRTKNQISQGKQLKSLIIDVSSTDKSQQDAIKGMVNSIQAVARAEEIIFDAANNQCDDLNIKIDIEAA